MLENAVIMDSRLRGNDEMGYTQCNAVSVRTNSNLILIIDHNISYLSRTI
jgi:hypothetical protein